MHFLLLCCLGLDFFETCIKDSVVIGSSLGVFLCGALLQRDPVVESFLSWELIPVPSTVGTVPKTRKYYRYAILVRLVHKRVIGGIRIKTTATQNIVCLIDCLFLFFLLQ